VIAERRGGLNALAHAPAAPLSALLRRCLLTAMPAQSRRPRVLRWVLAWWFASTCLWCAGAEPDRFRFQIPAQSLDEALLTLARQSGLQLAVAGDLNLARHSVEITGIMTVEAALQRLLQGSGYGFELRPDGMVTVRALQHPPAPVRPLAPPQPPVDLSTVMVCARRRADAPGTGLRRGTPVYNIPRLSVAGSVRYSWSMQAMTIPISVHFHHHSRRRTGLLGNGASGDPMTALSLHLNLDSVHGWGTYLHIDNLTNEGGAVDGRTARGEAIRLRPRSMGIGLYYQY